jgi:hypothetical protein
MRPDYRNGREEEQAAARRYECTNARKHEKTKKRKNGSILTVVLALALLGLSSCGYRVASTNRLPTGITTIAVLPFENETTTFKVEQVLTQSVIRSLVEKSSYRVTRDPAKAEGVLQGVISRVTANPVIFGEETFGSTFLVTLNVRVELRERQTGKILFKNDEYIFREQYIINVDVENFFSELNPALARIADDFGSSVVTTLLEGF